MNIEEIATQIVDSAFKVHSTLGPGLLESAYQTCLRYELEKRGIQSAIEVPQPVDYDGVFLDVGYRIDLIVEKCIVIENKCVDQLLPIHEAQLLTYLRLGGYTLGFIINWKVKLIKLGLKRFALNHPEPQWQSTHQTLKKS
jgi:GxxExxY protein